MITFTLHLFSVSSNLSRMFPFSFTAANHIVFIFGLSLSISICINIIGLETYGMKFLRILQDVSVL